MGQRTLVRAADRMGTYTISNIAGGDERTYAWTGGLCSMALGHARRISDGAHGGPAFGGPFGVEASRAWDRWYDEYLDGDQEVSS